MRHLLLSDTHGKLGIINELAEHTQADAIIHAGDFGFYDNGSYERLSNRELRLQIIHSGINILLSRSILHGGVARRLNRPAIRPPRALPCRRLDSLRM